MKAKLVPLSTERRWLPNRATRQTPWAMPPLPMALGRGFTMRCPACGEAKLFEGYLTVVPVCPNCAAPLGLARADYAPPYFTIVVVAHVILPSMLTVEKAYHPPLWLHAAIWLPLTLAMTLLLLRPIKGATVGLMMKLGLMKSDADE